MESKKSGDYDQEDAKHVLRIPIVWGGYINPTNNETRTARNKGHDPERQGWRRRALIDFAPVISAFAALATLIATVFLTIYARDQLSTMRGQLEEMQGSSADTRAVADAAKDQATNTEKLAVAAQEQMVVFRDLAGATKSAATTADQTLMLTHRPWVMVTHQMVTYQMVKPSRTEVALRFGKDDRGDVSAWLTLDEGLENIGHSVAVDVVSWSEVIPAENTRRDPFGYQSALARRKRRCDELRHPKATTPPGSVLFPQHKYPPVGRLLVTKDGTVRRAISLADHLWKERIGSPSKGSIHLIVVGCISYRASFEVPAVPRHQTRFMYELGYPSKGGVGAILKPFMKLDPELGLVPITEETTAD